MMKIEDLQDEELSSVSFVMDYVELSFHGPIIRLLGSFKIIDNLVEVTYPQEGSRDKLCELIGESLKSVLFNDEEECRLRIGDKTDILIQLRETKDIPEHMHFVQGDNEPMEIW